MFLLLALVSICFSTPVFRSIDSPLPSGNYSTKDLKKNQKRVVSRAWNLVRSGRRLGWMPSSAGYSSWDIVRRAHTSDETPVRKLAQWDSPVVDSISKGASVELLAVEEDWAHVSYGEQKGWIHLPTLQPNTKDLGFAIARENTSLFSDTKKAAITARIDSRSRLRIIAIKDGFFEVEYMEKKGYMTPSTTISFVDFAQSVSIDGKSFHPVLRRNSTTLTISKLENISIEKVQSFRLSQRLIISRKRFQLLSKPQLSSKGSHSVDKFQRLIVKNVDVQRWSLSNINGEDFWWKLDTPTAERLNPKSISTKELFARKVFSMESSPAQPNLMFASAKGVFRSADGKNWRKISGFEEKDYPIAIAASGTILIGPYRSDDSGKTFQEYVAWHKIAKAIRKKGDAEFLEIRKVEFLDKKGHSYQLSIDNGNARASVYTPDNGKTWLLR